MEKIIYAFLLLQITYYEIASLPAKMLAFPVTFFLFLGFPVPFPFTEDVLKWKKILFCSSSSPFWAEVGESSALFFSSHLSISTLEWRCLILFFMDISTRKVASMCRNKYFATLTVKYLFLSRVHTLANFTFLSYCICQYGSWPLIIQCKLCAFMNLYGKLHKSGVNFFCGRRWRY